MARRKKGLNDLGSFIKEHRIKVGLTQEELAKALTDRGFKRAGSTVTGWERGHGNVPEKLLPTLANILQVEPNEILRAANLLQTTPRSRLETILTELGVTDQEIEDNIDLITMIFKKKR